MVSLIYQYQKKYIQKWQDDHKEELIEKRKTLKYCECCKREYKYNCYINHKKTKKHLKKLDMFNNLNDEILLNMSILI